VARLDEPVVCVVLDLLAGGVDERAGTDAAVKVVVVDLDRGYASVAALTCRARRSARSLRLRRYCSNCA
jgi:hypothetical protein